MPSTSYQPRYRTANADEDLVVSRREYISDVYTGTGTPTAFVLGATKLNPGLTPDNGGLFSWLPQIAQGYSQYSFEQCIFQYHAISGDSTGANTSLGSVFMAANYIASDAPFLNKNDILNSQYAVSGPPSRDLVFPIECRKESRNLKMHQVRTGALKTGQNIDMFDLCTLMIGTQGCPSPNQVIGELYVTYTVRFSKHKTNDPQLSMRTAKYQGSNASGGYTSNYPLGQSGVALVQAAAQNGLPLTIADGGGTGPVIAFPPSVANGTYQVSIQWRNTGSVAWVFPTRTFTNCAAATCLYSPLSGAGQVSSGATGANAVTQATLIFYVTITGQNALIQLGAAGTIPAGTTDCSLVITEVNPLVCIQGN